MFFFFKQKTAYEMRISDWSSDVCSSDLGVRAVGHIDVDRILIGPTDHYLVRGDPLDLCRRWGAGDRRNRQRHDQRKRKCVYFSGHNHCSLDQNVARTPTRKRDRKSVGEGESVKVGVDLG